jgi:heterodisulfide reductase subunit C
MRNKMDLEPNQIMRLMQLGLKDTALDSSTIWMCISCETCATRCPRELELPRVMDTLRSMSRGRENQEEFELWPFVKGLFSRAYRGLLRIVHLEPDENVQVFNSVFLENIRRHGRSFEMSLIGGSNSGTGYMTRNLRKAPIMFLKGKMHFWPEKISEERKERLEKIFARIEDLEETKI